MTSAPTGKSGRFSRVLSAVRAVVIIYALLYAIMVIGGYGWLKTQSTVQMPQGAGFAFSAAPPGLALDIPELKFTSGDMPIALKDVRHVWPLLTPWRMQTTAVTGSLQIPHGTNHDQLDAANVQIDFSLPYTLTATAASVDWRIVLHEMKNGETEGDATTLVSPKLVYTRGFLGLNGPAQVAEFSAAPIMLPTETMQAVLQVDSLKFRLSANRALPDNVERKTIEAWQQAGGRLSLEDFNLSVVGMELLLAGDVNLDDKLDMAGNMQLQLSGIGAGYTRLGQMNIIPPQHYRLLGYLLQAMPEAGQKTFTLPVKIQRNKLYVGPAAAFSFGILPWQTATDNLLNTPVAGSPADMGPTGNVITQPAAPVVEPQTLAPANTVSVPVTEAGEVKAAPPIHTAPKAVQ